MRHLLPFVVAILLVACQSTKQSTKQMSTTDYDLLNGLWEGDCSLVVTGDFKGEIECPIEEAESLTTILLNKQKEGVWVSQRDDNQPDTTKMKLTIRGNRAVLQMEQRGKQWEREVFSVTQDSLKVYTSNMEYLALFRRKK